MVKLVNRAKMKVASGGAGTLTLGTACDGYQTFAAAGVTDQNKLRYTITDGNDWEIGIGTYTASGTTLARAVTESSNSGNAITCGSGAEIFVTMAAEDFSGNAAPIWTTTPPSTLSLANDGSTAVTLAGVAIDEFPVRYSWDGYSGTSLYDADTLPPQLASAPTFSGGTASLIGSSTQSNAGSFNFRLRASDGVKTATAITAVNLSFGYNITSASYDNLSFSVASQESNPLVLEFNSDGTKMFVIGGNDTVHQYSLTNDFSLASGNVTYDNESFSVTSQESTPQGLTFSSDGTKMFVIGLTTDSVHQYSLTNGFSLASGNVSYDNLSFSVASQEGTPRSLAFSSDGTKMFVIGSASGAVYQYSLTNGFSLASGNVSYDNLSFSVASQEGGPTSLAFSSDGTKMFIVGFNGNTVHQYSLTNGFSLASGNVTYDNTSFSVTSQETSPRGLAFNSNGTKMFVIGADSDAVYQYSTAG
jgi:sugar lactone lactonase YvrE